METGNRHMGSETLYGAGERSDGMLKKELQANRTPGLLYLIFDRQHVIHEFTGGFADISSKAPMQLSTTFNAFSVTKTFTALAILQLAEQGKIQLDSSHRLYLPDSVYPATITVQHLLNHSSGIPNPIPLTWIHLRDSSFDEKKFFAKIFASHRKLRFNPGDRFYYSNLNYVLLGELVAAVSGTTYADFVSSHILNMISSPEQLSFSVTNPTKHATGYHKKWSVSNLLLSLFLDKRTFMGSAQEGWVPFNPFYVNGSAYGGLIGSGVGLRKYLQELLSAECSLIKPDFKEMMFTAGSTRSRASDKMCMAWFKGTLNGHTFFTHAGGGGGYYVEIRLYPGRGLGSVLVFNRTGMSDVRFLDQVDRFFI